MNDEIPLSYLNDFIFCPISIYFHNFYMNLEKKIYQSPYQLNGTAAHEAIEDGRYSSRTNVLKAISVYSDKYNLIGKIDTFDNSSGVLTERKKKVVRIYDGYVFQIYGQYFALVEMGYKVLSLKIYSMDDNKVYKIPLPSEDLVMFHKFEQVIHDINSFDMLQFSQTNIEKCKQCIYEPACDRSLL